MCVLFFFCKQKTAYEVRISDWSSDVCSSDLARSGPVLSVSHSERIDHGCSNARGYRNRPSQGPAGQGPVAGIRSPRRYPEPQGRCPPQDHPRRSARSEEHTSELQSLMRISYAVFCLKKQTLNSNYNNELAVCSSLARNVNYHE